MRQVIIVSLNNNAYHFEEDAYRDLRRYLRRAQSGLKNNPDVGEILGDLERSIAEKCTAALSTIKNVISQEDITRILNEVGPVVADPLTDADENETEADRPRRLRRQPHGGVLYGVCSGLADYFGMNVVIVRIIFLALLMFNGLGGVIYVLLRIAMPAAEPVGEERTYPVVLALTTVLVVVLAANIVPSILPWGFLAVDVAPPWFWPGHRMGMLPLPGVFYLVILATIIGVGAALIKFLLSRARTR